MFNLAKTGYKNISKTMSHNEFDFIEDIIIPIQVNYLL